MQAITDVQILGPLPPYFLGLEDAEMRLRSESVLYIHVNMHLLHSFPCLSLQFNKKIHPMISLLLTNSLFLVIWIFYRFFF